MTLMEELMNICKLNHVTDKLIQLEINQLRQIMVRYEIERLQAMPCYQDAKRLEPFGFKVYSQNDEDGIIHEIFNRIGTTNKCFVEFGVGDGLENNTHFLLFQGWEGLWIEADSQSYKNICDVFHTAIQNNHLTVNKSFVSRENINELIASRFKGEIDLLSIDIDGNDYHVFEDISIISPRVVVIEYNAKFPPYINWRMKYNPNHNWDGSDKQGASLKALELLGKEKGYQLVGTNLNGVNAFFVRNDLAKNLFYEPATSEHLYNTYKFISFQNGHVAKHFLADEGTCGE